MRTEERKSCDRYHNLVDLYHYCDKRHRIRCDPKGRLQRWARCALRGWHNEETSDAAVLTINSVPFLRGSFHLAFRNGRGGLRLLASMHTLTCGCVLLPRVLSTQSPKTP